jgi:hypothetical protein
MKAKENERDKTAIARDKLSVGYHRLDMNVTGGRSN